MRKVEVRIDKRRTPKSVGKAAAALSRSIQCHWKDCFPREHSSSTFHWRANLYSRKRTMNWPSVDFGYKSAEQRSSSHFAGMTTRRSHR